MVHNLVTLNLIQHDADYILAEELTQSVTEDYKSYTEKILS